MRTIYGKLTAMILAITLGLALLLPMRVGQEDQLYASPGHITLKRGQSRAIHCTLDADRAQTIAYASMDKDVATVNARGVVSAVAPGTTDIRITAENGAKAAVRVDVRGEPTTKLWLNTDSLQMEKGQVTGLSASFNEGAEDTRLEWRSEDPEIAQVNIVGQVTALKGGRTKVYAAAPNGLKAAADVFVHVSGDHLRMTPEELTLGTGASLTITPVWYPDDTTDTVSRWVTSDERLLTVKDGTIRAVGVGNPVLTVISEEGLSNSMVIKVEPSAASFDLVPAAATIERGDELDIKTRFLDAQGNEYPPSEKHYIVWKSSDPSVATVDEGHVKGLRSGKATISATVDGVTAKCDLQVQVLIHEITLNENEIYMLKSATSMPIQLEATYQPTDPDDPTITWLTSNDLVAKVDEHGLVTMTGLYGSAVITARAVSGAEAHFNVHMVVELPKLDKNTGEIVTPAVEGSNEGN